MTKTGKTDETAFDGSFTLLPACLLSYRHGVQAGALKDGLRALSIRKIRQGKYFNVFFNHFKADFI